MHDLNMISCDGQRPWFAGDPQGLNMRNSMASQPASSASRAFVRGETERSGSAMYSHLYFLGMLVGAATLLRHEELRLVELQLPLILLSMIDECFFFENNYEILGFPSN